MADTYLTSDAPRSETDELAGPDAGNAGQSDEQILNEAKARFELAKDAETDNRLDALDDMKFAAGEQWDPGVRQSREQKRRPCLTINRLPQFIRQVTNDQRQNRPSIKVHPVDDAADVETGKIIQGLIRHIEYNSNADAARDTAFEGSVRGGFGFYRVVTAYVDPTSFDQEILIKRIRNPLSVFFDPHSTEPDGSDANFAFVTEDLSKDEYERQFPGSKLAAPGAWEAAGNNAPAWMSEKTARVAEYFYKEYQDVTIHQLSTGETVENQDLEARLQSAAQAGIHVQVVKSRATKKPVIKWCKLNAVEILEKTDWPGSYIPIIPVYGEELVIDGRRILKGIVRDAKDPQRMLNVWKSAETEAIGLAPKAPWVVDARSIEGYERIWETANTETHAYLPYNARTDLPAPSRQAFEPAVQAITNAAQFAAEDIKSTTGVFGQGPDAHAPGASGVAINNRNSQVQTSNFHFVDNLTRSIRHEGRILVDLIPHVYDTARAVRIVKEDGTQDVVKLNQEHEGDDGKPVLYSMDTGRYDVTVDTGPSFASRRQEAASMMQEMTRAAPQLMNMIGDLMFRNMDVPGAEAIADRLKKALPPQFQDAPNMKDVPPQMIAQMNQMHQMIDGLTKNLNEATKVIETKKLDLEHRERVELAKIQAQLEMKAAELGSREDIAMMNNQIAAIQHRLELLSNAQPIDAPQDFDPQGADGGNYAGIGHIGGSENLTGGEQSPGSPMEGQT